MDVCRSAQATCPDKSQLVGPGSPHSSPGAPLQVLLAQLLSVFPDSKHGFPGAPGLGGARCLWSSKLSLSTSPLPRGPRLQPNMPTVLFALAHLNGQGHGQAMQPRVDETVGDVINKMTILVLAE